MQYFEILILKIDQLFIWNSNLTGRLTFYLASPPATPGYFLPHYTQGIYFFSWRGDQGGSLLNSKVKQTFLNIVIQIVVYRQDSLIPKKPDCDVDGRGLIGPSNHSLEAAQRAGGNLERTQEQMPEFWKEVERSSRNQKVKKFRGNEPGVWLYCYVGPHQGSQQVLPPWSSQGR